MKYSFKLINRHCVHNGFNTTIYFDYTNKGKNGMILHKLFCTSSANSANSSSPDAEADINSERSFKQNLADLLREQNDIQIINGLYETNKSVFERDLEFTLLFLDIYASKFDQGQNIEYFEIAKNKLVMSIISQVEERILDIDPFFILSFFETITKFKHFDNKLWLKFEYILIQTNFIYEIDIKYYHLLLKGFENFFSRAKESVIPTEEIFEFIENQLIINIKRLITEEKLYSSIDLKNLIDNYIIFGKNLEGSRDLFDLLIKTIREHRNFKKTSLDCLICVYFVSILIESNVYSNKTLTSFIKSLESLINSNDVNNFEETFKQDNQVKYLFKWSVLRKQNKEMLRKLDVLNKTDLELI